MKLTPLLFSVALLSGGVAHADSIEAAADTYVQADNAGPFGGAALVVKNTGGGSFTRKSLIRFTTSGAKVASANLSLDVVLQNNTTIGPSTATINVWGIKDGAASSCGESFSEDSLRYNDLSFLDNSVDGVIDDSPCVQPLGTFTLSAADTGNTVDFSSKALADFINEDTNGVVTFALTRQENNGQLNTTFASKEHSTLHAPKLSWIPKELYTATADTYVMRNNTGGHGEEPNLVTTNYGADNYTRKSILRFEVPADSFADASLSLDLSNYTTYSGGSTTSTFYLYGIKDGAASPCQENFSETGIFGLLYNSVPFLDDSPDGVINTSDCLHSVGALATLEVTSADLNKTVTFSSEALTSFLNDNQNGYATFVLTRSQDAVFTSFASRTHPTLHPPTLSVTKGGSISFTGDDATTDSNGVVHYIGPLQIPLGGGDVIKFRLADVNATYNEDGDLQTLSGNVGLPELPAGGAWSMMGPMSDLPELGIGYDFPDNFDPERHLPLNAGTKYFYLVIDGEVGFSWGLLGLTLPGAEMTIAIDPVTPALFTYGQQYGLIPGSGTLTAVIGISNKQNIPFYPWSDWGVEPYMNGFSGNIYTGAAISFPVVGTNSYALVAGDTTIGAGEHGLNILGVNGTLHTGFFAGFFWLDIESAVASLLYNNDNHSVTFSAEIDPMASFDRLLPPFIKLGGNAAKISGYLSDTESDNYVQIAGEFLLNPSVVGALFNQTISGFALFTNDGISFEGEARFKFTKVKLLGEIYEHYVYLAGKVKPHFGVNLGSGISGNIKAEIEISFDSRKSEVEFSATASLGVSGEEIHIGVDSVTVDGDGGIKICFHVPGVGQKCFKVD